MAEELSPLAERIIRDGFTELERAKRAEGDVSGYDSAAFALALAVGKAPDEAAAGTMTAMLEQKAWEEEPVAAPEPPPRLRLPAAPPRRRDSGGAARRGACLRSSQRPWSRQSGGTAASRAA